MDVEQFLVDVTGDNLLAWKTAVASVVVALASLQVAVAARFWRGGGLPVDSTTARSIHLWNGRVLLGLTVVVAYGCLFGPAGPTSPLRVLLHSVLGTTLFVLLAAKVAAVHLEVERLSDRLPLIGGLLFTNYVLVWALSALDYVAAERRPPPDASLRVWVWVLAAVALALGGLGASAFARRR